MNYFIDNLDFINYFCLVILIRTYQKTAVETVSCISLLNHLSAK